MDPWKGEDGVLEKGKHIPAEKHDLQNIVLIIADSRSAMLPEEPLQLYSRQYSDVYHFLRIPLTILDSVGKSTIFWGTPPAVV